MTVDACITFARKVECEEDGLYFNRYFFKQRFGTKMIIGRHHSVMQAALDRTMLPPDHPDFISRLIINVSPGYTKCSVSGTMVHNQEGCTMIDNVEIGDKLKSFDSGSLVERLVIGKEKYTKRCVDIKLLSGRKLSISYDHPVLTQRGWVEAGKLTEDHYMIRLCSKIDGGSAISSDELDFVTLMIFEGGCSNTRAPRFTSADTDVMDVMQCAADGLGINMVKYECNRPYDYNFLGGKSGNAAKILDKYRINGCLATEKRLPSCFFNMPLKQKMRFISLMVATDGFITKNHGQIGVTLANEPLIDDISLLLDGCGIPTSKYHQENGHAGAYTLMISPFHAKELLGKVDFLQKQEKFERVCEMRPKLGSLIFGYPIDVTKGLTGKFQRVRPRINIKYRAPITDYLFSRIKNEIDSSVSRFQMDDFIYDRVKSIECIGDQTVYHLSIRADDYDGKNYLANGLVVHNTELCSINYMARGLAVNPMARFLHLSYSDKLVLLNSGVSREVVKSSAFQQMWEVETKNDTDSKHIWHTITNGGVTATAAGGQVTGFRAGHMDYSQFTGALVIDDPVKPDDAYSETIRGNVNNAYNETIASRVAIETVPIIVVMQRIHWNDLSGYLLRGGSGEKWHHLNLPVIINNSDRYPKEYTHGIPIDHGLSDGWLWPFKHNEKHEIPLRSHRRKFWAQYMQNPIKRDEETALWTEVMIRKARDSHADGRVPIKTIIAVDPAVSNTEKSDEHGIVAASAYKGNRYSIDGDYSIKGSPKTWADRAIAAYEKHEASAIVIEVNQGGDMCESTLRAAGFTGKIIMIRATKGKTIRAEPIAALYEQGFVSHSSGLLTLEEELMDFDPVTQKSNGKSPNRVDAGVWALTGLSKPTTRIQFG